jgi:hypothetical protein
MFSTNLLDNNSQMHNNWGLLDATPLIVLYLSLQDMAYPLLYSTLSLHYGSEDLLSTLLTLQHSLEAQWPVVAYQWWIWHWNKSTNDTIYYEITLLAIFQPWIQA